MRALIALDKFKEALTAPAACDAVTSSLRKHHPDWSLDLCPLADGGDGFVAALCADGRGHIQSTTVGDPHGNPVAANWALVAAHKVPAALRDRLDLGQEPVAIIEMATCSGLALIPALLRDPLQATSHGVGELISAARTAGATTVLLGVGGSATNDFGLGALEALDFRFFDLSGERIQRPSPVTWPRISRIEPPRSTRQNVLNIWIACDVTNPLTGPNGATFTYGPQKGLANDRLALVDRDMERLAAMLATATAAPQSLFEQAGAGAAGGIAGGLMAGCRARLIGGFDLVATWLDLEQRIRAADVIITGEGAFDATSLQGKGPGELVRRALASQKRVVVLAGKIQVTDTTAGLELHPITPADMPLKEALPATFRLLSEAADAHI